MAQDLVATVHDVLQHGYGDIQLQRDAAGVRATSITYIFKPAEHQTLESFLQSVIAASQPGDSIAFRVRHRRVEVAHIDRPI